jgi:hypothetical protein
MLSDAEIIRRLRAIRFSPMPERFARRLPSINALHKATDISRVHLYRIIRNGQLGPKARALLSDALHVTDRIGEERGL